MPTRFKLKISLLIFSIFLVFKVPFANFNLKDVGSSVAKADKPVQLECADEKEFSDERDGQWDYFAIHDKADNPVIHNLSSIKPIVLLGSINHFIERPSLRGPPSGSLS
ncbi:MAG: hypothetical protein KDD33_02955 [Bdellovibrionales bacterium]|nr:hypothetical protein [Bdellovibrionales bacterium]